MSPREYFNRSATAINVAYHRTSHFLRSLIAAFAITIVASLFLVLNNFCGGSDDDLGIAVALSTLYPDAGECPFTNALLNQVIYSFNSFFSLLNWELVFERISATLGLFVVAFSLMYFCRKSFAVTGIGFVLAVLYPLCTVSANFTCVSALDVFAGEIAILLAISNKNPAFTLIGVFLVVLGFMWRPNVLLLSLPFFMGTLIVAVTLVIKNRETLNWKLALLKIFSGTAGAAILILFLSGYNQVVWEDPALNKWESFSEARSQLCDYPTKPYEDIADELENLGVSKNDYWCMTNWVTADPDYFTTERMQAVAEIARDTESSDIQTSFVNETNLLFSAHAIIPILLLGIIASAAIISGIPAIYVGGISIACAFLISMLFLYTGRLPIRVEYSIWAMSLLPLAPLLAKRGFRHSTEDQSMNSIAVNDSDEKAESISARIEKERDRNAMIISVIIAIGCTVSLLYQYACTFDPQRIDQFQSDSQFAAQRPLVQKFSQNESINIWEAGAYSYVEKELQYRFLPPANFIDKNALLGGWNQRAPMITAQNELMGIPNPIKSLLDNPQTRLVVLNEKVAKHILKFLKEHYDSKARQHEIEVIECDRENNIYLFVSSFYSAPIKNKKSTSKREKAYTSINKKNRTTEKAKSKKRPALESLFKIGDQIAIHPSKVHLRLPPQS